MSTGTTTMTTAGGPGGPAAVPAKGLRAGILDLGDSVMLGLASTAPVYSLAATLGLIVAVNGNYTPLILLLGFVPVLFIAFAFRELNSAMPDCGTTFIWARRAFGPWAGWLGGWGVALAGVVVLANLAQVAGQYLWLLIGDGSLAGNSLVVTATGVLFIVFMTFVNYRGIRLGEHVQRVLTYVQYLSLGIFAMAIIFRIAGGVPGAAPGQAFDLEWFNPAGAFADPGAVVHGALLALFIYWGWDTCLAVNEETENPCHHARPRRRHFRACPRGDLRLRGPAGDDVCHRGHGGDRAGQRGQPERCLPGHEGRGAGPLGLADRRRRPGLGAVLDPDHHSSHGPRHLVHGRARSGRAGSARSTRATRRRGIPPRSWVPRPSPITSLMSLLSENLLADSITSISLFIAFYYALTGFACVWYFRATLRGSARNFWFRGVMPLLGALMLTAAFFVSAVQMWDPDYGDTQIFGVGGAFISGVLLLGLGVALAAVCRFAPSTRGYFLQHQPAAGAPPAGAAVGCWHEQRSWHEQ